MLKLVNNGLYEITFEFEKLNKLAKRLFTIQPEKGQILPNQDQEILVKFYHTADYKLKQDSVSNVSLKVFEHTLNQQISE